MNKLFDLHISDEELMKLGKTLGADVPYCIMGGTALAEGIGEKLTPLNRITGDYVVIAKPKIGVSTKYVYENLDLS
jgi:4-diphosphocytidyl-2-C-methyl-D-erythritol kinase